MTAWVALFRGINVGGKNIVPMAELRKLLESLGCNEVRSYIQSGNAVFLSLIETRNDLGKRILSAIEHQWLLFQLKLSYSFVRIQMPKVAFVLINGMSK
jgi:uncharacterized protein (DUF1697 family)